MRWGITYRGSGYVPGRGDYSPPDEPDWCQCYDCRGTGRDSHGNECATCEGAGWFDELGNPVKEEA